MDITSLIIAFVKISVVLGGIMTAAAYFVLLERRVAAWVQDRRGPNRVGLPLTKIRLFGLGQPLADGAKMILKEEYTPAHVDRRLFVLAPIIIMSAALAVYAAIPFGSSLPPIPQLGINEPINLVIAPQLDVGMIYVFALSSIAVYGVILGGWASNNKYSFLGGLRSSAQMIAYELPLGLGLLGVILATGSLRLDAIVGQQADSVWFALAQPLGFVVFVVAAFAEAGRLPFDLPECEQELIGGYHTEYSGMKLVLFLTAEFIHMITASFLIVILFLGGWHFPGITGGSETEITWLLAALRIGVLLAKVFCVIFFFMLVRWSWPRFRFDQLMTLAWKIMLPLGVVNLISVAFITEFQHPSYFGGRFADASPTTTLIVCAAGWVVAIVSWIVVASLSPLVTDNRPRLDLDVYGVDSQLEP
ncbi:MAG: NADH-quinone oxidoreductase subunit NuoH [Planctomycetales bacterium]|nr:NADH-quinone oxidoreductase subunit NuoH [Planctomycetales bacterium]